MKAVCHISLSDSEDALVARQAKFQSWTHGLVYTRPTPPGTRRVPMPPPPTVLERAEQRFRVDRC